jgi:hypothetical protein
VLKIHDTTSLVSPKEKRQKNDAARFSGKSRPSARPSCDASSGRPRRLTERTVLEDYRVGPLLTALVMPGSAPGIQAAPWVIIRGHRPWVHASRPRMTKTENPALLSGHRLSAA